MVIQVGTVQAFNEIIYIFSTKNSKYITSKVKNGCVKCILININNPSNPYGSILSLSNLKGIMALAKI